MIYSHSVRIMGFLVSKLPLLTALAVAICACSLGAALAEDQKVCEQRLLKAQAMGLIKGYSSSSGKLAVVVDEGLFSGMAYNSKMGLAKTFDCAVAGPGKALAEAEFRSHRTNKRIALWSWGQLTVD